jgi:hypothetical protein
LQNYTLLRKITVTIDLNHQAKYADLINGKSTKVVRHCSLKLLVLQLSDAGILSKLDNGVTRDCELMIEIEPEPGAHKENKVNSAIDFGLEDEHKEVKSLC